MVPNVPSAQSSCQMNCSRNVHVLQYQRPALVLLHGFWHCQSGRVPAGKRAYELTFEAVDDDGALPPRVLRSRRQREETSLKAFQSGELVQKRMVNEAWLRRTKKAGGAEETYVYVAGARAVLSRSVDRADELRNTILGGA